MRRETYKWKLIQYDDDRNVIRRTYYPTAKPIIQLFGSKSYSPIRTMERGGKIDKYKDYKLERVFVPAFIINHDDLDDVTSFYQSQTPS